TEGYKYLQPDQLQQKIEQASEKLLGKSSIPSAPPISSTGSQTVLPSAPPVSPTTSLLEPLLSEMSPKERLLHEIRTVYDPVSSATLTPEDAKKKFIDQMTPIMKEIALKKDSFSMEDKRKFSKEAKKTYETLANRFIINKIIQPLRDILFPNPFSLPMVFEKTKPTQPQLETDIDAFKVLLKMAGALTPS